MSVAVTFVVEAYLSSVWTDITADVVTDVGLTLQYGIDANGPADVVASPGTLQFTLRNDAGCSGHLQGYYSPRNVNVRAGWGFGVAIRVVFTYAAVSYTKFYGKVNAIDPAPGKYKTQRVVVTAYDGVYDLLEADARSITLQIGQTESQLVAAVLAAVPASAQPLAQSLDTGVDTFPYAFDNISGGVKALPLIRDCVLSSAGLAFVTGAGTFTYKNRHTRATVASSATFNDDMLDLAAPSSVDHCWNKVRVTTHAKQISAAATDELYTLPTGSSIAIAAGATVTVWCDYSDPNTRAVPVGGTAVVTVLIAGTHYSANSAADGSGSNLSANIAPTLTPFASTGKYVLVNSGPDAFITLLKVIGKAVRDPGPQTYEATSTQTYGERSLAIDLPYQNDAAIGQSYATFVQAKYSNLTTQIDSLTIFANDSATFMTQALAREPSDRITVTETVTGIALLTAVIYRVALKVLPDGSLVCTWGLGPGSPFNAWQLGVAGVSELGTTTILGF